MMNTLTLPKRLLRLWRSLFRRETSSADDSSATTVDPFEKYKNRIPNRASRRALKELKRGKFKEFDSLDDLFADLNDD